MTPVNNKSLLHFIFDQMEKLNDKQIDVPTANAQANLMAQANKAMKYELERAKTLNELRGTGIDLREIEGKSFDNTI